MLYFTYVAQFRSLLSRSDRDKCCIFERDMNENAAHYICGTISFYIVPVLSWQLAAAFLKGTWTKMLHFTYVGQFRWFVSRSRHDNCCISVWYLNENAALNMCGTISFLCVPFLSGQLLHFRLGPERKCCTLHMWDNFVSLCPVFVRTTAAFLLVTWTKMPHFTYVWQFRSLVSRFCQDNCCIFVWYMNENAANSQWQVLHFVDHFDKNAAVDIRDRKSVV